MNVIKLPFEFDVEKLRAAYHGIPKSEFYCISNPSVTPDTLTSIHLIEPDKNEVFHPTKRLEQLPYLQEVLDTFICDKETFRIHTLAAGAKIKAHRDNALNYENGSLRLHIPIYTDPNIKMISEDQEFILKAGECWYFDFNKIHAVENNSSMDRVHLIIDCLSNDWWDSIMSDYGKSREQYERKMTAKELASFKKQLELIGSDVAKTLLKNLNE
ncbi:MAG: aspartyl/asparaginyl beta-hydroxylase domain-containing protein [Flavobacteriaceae bacterium]|nr:aspartyl/asparaginyl beta-hydroxylase domain-containing protein [Flavobacteriaceae bacterium]